MTSKTAQIDFEGSRLSFIVFGKGEETMIVLHGFGQNAKMLTHDLAALSNQYTFVLVDLFFHGQSYLDKKHQPISEQVWAGMLMVLIQNLKIEKPGILAFSMGCKFALSGWKQMPEYWRELVLLAPDGIRKNNWYALATWNRGTRFIFKLMTRQPFWLFGLMKLAGKLGIVKSSILKFIGSQLNSKTKRDMAYLVWVNFRLLGTKENEWPALLKVNPLPIEVWLGRYDKVIPAQLIKKRLSKVKGITVKEISTGHNGLLAKWVESKKTPD